MCTLQVYSHSVESRQYAIGVPIVVPGHDASLQTTKKDGIKFFSKDLGLDMSGLRDLCLPSTAQSADIQNAVPRWARLVSDVYNHAYQNSDYSPYSGQQQEAISKNLQASAIIKMESGNRGELGKSILPAATKSRLNYLQNLEDKIHKNYETLANRIINRLGNTNMKSSGMIGAQNLANCFRCMEAGSTTYQRQQTNTYIPAFQLAKGLIPAARQLVPRQYQSLITDSGLVQIYAASANDLMPFFYKSRALGVVYQPAKLKITAKTAPDITGFRKRTANGQVDNGYFAARVAKVKQAANAGCPSQCLNIDVNAARKAGSAAAKPEECKWAQHANQMASGYADRGRYNLAQAKSKCLQMAGACKAVTCQRGYYGRPPSCTLRSSSQLRRSYYGGQTTYQTSLACQLGLAEGSVEGPLVNGFSATNLAGACAPCGQFFGKKLKSPPTTPLDEKISDGKKLDDLDKEGKLRGCVGSGDDDECDNDNDKKKKPSARRRRRAAGRRRSSLIQAGVAGTRRRRRTVLIQEHIA